MSRTDLLFIAAWLGTLAWLLIQTFIDPYHHRQPGAPPARGQGRREDRPDQGREGPR